MKPLLEQGLDPVLRRWSSERRHAGVPPGRHFDVRRQTVGVDQAIAHLSNEAMRVASASTNPSSGSDRFT
jgi:hypothetical protein